MDDATVGAYWEGNAEAWTALSRAGFDKYRDAVNTPAFLELLPSVAGLRGLDIGCGEGTNTRAVAELGATMTGIDIAPTFIRHALDVEHRDPLGISYEVCSAAALPFDDASFDFATAFMSLMDVADYRQALREAARVVRPGGFLQFSIIHPCFGLRDAPLRKTRADRSPSASRATSIAPNGSRSGPSSMSLIPRAIDMRLSECPASAKHFPTGSMRSATPVSSSSACANPKRRTSR